jgi:AraC-like DNA-binding protein
MGAVLSGFFSYSTELSTCALSPGAILLGNKGGSYRCSHEHSQGDCNLVFAVGEPMIEAVLRCAGTASADAEFSLPCLPPAPELSVTIARAEAAADARDAFWLEEIAYALLASALLPDEQQSNPTPASSKDAGRIADAIRFIEENFASRLTLSDLAAICDVSPFHFVRIFGLVTGTSPYRYLVQFRLRHAAALLLRTELPVTDIAFEVGFGDLTQFIRKFKAASGLTPRAFRSAYS